MKTFLGTAIQAFLLTLIVGALAQGLLSAFCDEDQCDGPCWFLTCVH